MTELEDFQRKWKARSITAKALAKGELKQQPCKVCGSPDTEMHHTDYDKPLDIEWLCRSHHKQKHSKLKLLIACKKCGYSNTYSTLNYIVCRKCGHHEPRGKK